MSELTPRQIIALRFYQEECDNARNVQRQCDMECEAPPDWTYDDGELMRRSYERADRFLETGGYHE